MQMFHLLLAWTTCWRKSPVTIDLRCYDPHVTSIIKFSTHQSLAAAHDKVLVGFTQHASFLKKRHCSCVHHELLKWVSKCVSAWEKEWVSKRASENQSVNGWASERVSDWLNEWVSEWVGENQCPWCWCPTDCICQVIRMGLLLGKNHAFVYLWKK